MAKKDAKKKTEKVPVKKETGEQEKERAMLEREQGRYWQPFDLMRQFEHEMDELFRDFESRYYFPRRFRGHGGYRFPAVR